jgi:lambda family phage portal protein
MNMFDRAIATLSPKTAVKREVARKQLEVLNSGYSNYGASFEKKSMVGWNYGGGSSREDVEDNLPQLRERCRDLYMGVPLATGALKTYRTSVIGAGLTLKPKVDYEALRISEQQAEELEKQINREWNLWSDSVDCDAARLSNFYELQQLAFLNWTMSGDVLILLPTWKRAGSIYDLRVNMIEADRCYTPPGKDRPDDRIVDGVERNDRGEIEAYYIAKRHPKGRFGMYNQEFTRVSAYGARTGRRNVLHLMNRERIGQVRGVPLLAPVIECLKNMGRYSEAELTAAVVASYQTIFIETENDTNEEPFGEILPEDQQVDREDRGTVEMGSGAIVDLAPGEKAKLVSPARPNTAFDGFISSLCKQIGSALELPQELLLKTFTSSYSASRGALLEAWKTFDMYRDWMVSGFCQPIYEEWMTEAVAKGRINAPGFFQDTAIRKAYTKAEWYGASRGQIDPLKEVQAAQVRVQCGFSTGTKEAMELTGTDFRDNVAQMKQEARMTSEVTGTQQAKENADRGEEEDDES